MSAQTMKAIAKTSPGFGAELVELPVPNPQPRELLVRIAACGICGSDLHFYEWELGAERIVSRLPFVLGHEPAGEVVSVGSEVKEFQPGDRVALDPFGRCGDCGPCRAGRFHLCQQPTVLSGALAEYAIAPVRNSYRVPDSISWAEAALLEPFATGLHAVEQADFKPGDSVVVEGPGPIGLSVALAARAMGAGTVVVTGLEEDRRRLELAREMGFATVSVAGPDWPERVRGLLPADGADVVFDACGMMDRVRALVRRGGQLVELGWPARDIPAAEMRALFFHGVTIISSRIRTPETWRRAITLVANRQVDLNPLITDRFPLSRGLEAFELLRERKAVKALIMPSE